MLSNSAEGTTKTNAIKFETWLKAPVPINDNYRYHRTTNQAFPILSTAQDAT